MEQSKKCLCSNSDVKIVACSGASNVGQISNQAALEISKENVGGFFCLAESEPTSKEWSNPERKRT